MIDFLSSLRITLWVIGSFLVLLFIHFFWNAFPQVLYAPVLLLFYLNLFSCITKRLRTWKRITAARIAFVCFHLGLAIIAGGTLLTTLGKFQGNFEVAQNQSFIDKKDYYELIEGPFVGTPGFTGEFFFLKDVDIDVHDNGQLKKFTCTVIKNNDSSNVETLKPNHPITLGGGNIYPVTRMHGNAVRFQALYANGKVSEGSVNFPVDSEQHSFFVPGTNELVHVELINEQSGTMRLSWNGMTRNVVPGEFIRLNDVGLHYLESVPWVGMVLSRDPGKPFVYCGFILTAFGIIAYYLTKGRQ